jgi:hypothetical protein
MRIYKRLFESQDNRALLGIVVDGSDCPLLRLVAHSVLALNSTPKAVVPLHLTAQSRDGLPSLDLNVNIEGMPIVFSTISRAPPSDKSRMVHERD